MRGDKNGLRYYYHQSRYYKDYIWGKIKANPQQFTISAILALSIYLYFFINTDFFWLYILRNVNFTRDCLGERELHNKNPKIGIIMSYESNYGQLGYLSEIDKQYYSKLHNYTLLVNKDVLNPTRKPSWNKVLMAIKHLPEFDWLLYVDADTLIMNHDFKIIDLIDDRYDMIIGEDHRGLNAGVWMIKNSYWSEVFLRTWYFEGENFVQDPTLPFGKSGDQDTLIYFISKYPDDDIDDHVKVVNQCAFNSFPYYRGNYNGVYMNGDFLVHFASKGSIEERELLFKYFMNQNLYINMDHVE